MALLDDLSSLIENMFGEETAGTIRKYYSDEKPEVIMQVCKHMIIELVGRKNGMKHLTPIMQKYRLKESAK